MSISKKTVDLRTLGSKSLPMRQSCAQSPDQLRERYHDAQRETAEALKELEAAHADVQLRDEELVLAEAKCIQASRRLAECKMLEHSAREAYRPHAKWISRGGCREQDLA
jgi:hypothetical protein